jgi:hypothetical protein
VNFKTITLAVVGGLALYATPTYAQYYWPRSPSINHRRHHDDLDHRAYHRELDHRQAHRYPMTWRQHERLHDQLDHEAFHDYLEHRSAHRSGAYYRRYTPQWYGGYGRPGSGFGFSGRNFSIWIGR